MNRRDIKVCWAGTVGTTPLPAFHHHHIIHNMTLNRIYNCIPLSFCTETSCSSQVDAFFNFIFSYYLWPLLTHVLHYNYTWQLLIIQFWSNWDLFKEPSLTVLIQVASFYSNAILSNHSSSLLSENLTFSVIWKGLLYLLIIHLIIDCKLHESSGVSCLIYQEVPVI